MVTYFAYGSNMLAQRLQARCTSARALGLAFIEGFELEFSKKSKDNSGKATLVESSNPLARVFGVVYQIADCEIEALDKIEGRGQGYEREQVLVVLHPDGGKIPVTTYIGVTGYLDQTLQPYDWYMDLIVKGAEQQGLPLDYLHALESIAIQPDPNIKRPSRLEALKILAGIGAS
jgi:gamma-glutamylcyclotransferase (GGCT)/AIG2-like uncharacterized protein YtfP